MSFARRNLMSIVAATVALLLLLLYFVPWSSLLIRNEGSLKPLASWQVQGADKAGAVAARIDAYAHARGIRYALYRTDPYNRLYAQLNEGSCDYHVEQIASASYEVQMFELAGVAPPCDTNQIERDMRRILGGSPSRKTGNGTSD